MTVTREQVGVQIADSGSPMESAPALDHECEGKLTLQPWTEEAREIWAAELLLQTAAPPGRTCFGSGKPLAVATRRLLPVLGKRTSGVSPEVSDGSHESLGTAELRTSADRPSVERTSVASPNEKRLSCIKQWLSTGGFLSHQLPRVESGKQAES